MAYNYQDGYSYSYGDEDGDGEGTGITHQSSPQGGPPPPPAATIARQVGRVDGTENDYQQPDPTVQRQIVIEPTQRQRPARSTNINIEEAISQTVVDYIAESKEFGVSLLRGIRRYVVPFATLMDLSSAVLRFLTLSFLLLLPALYNNIFNPPSGGSIGAIAWQVAHYTILIISVLGIAVGVPVALFSSVYSLVTLLTRREAVYSMTSRKARNERFKYFRMKIRAAWRYIITAFLAGAFISVPYFTSQDKHFPAEARQVISEISFILVPIICTIVTMITERETHMDMVEGGSRMGTGLAMFTIFEAGVRLAQGEGTTQDAAAINNGMNGQIAAAIAAGVKEDPNEEYYTLADIAERLGRSPSRSDSFRRTLNNVVGAAFKTGRYGIILHAQKGYLVPSRHFTTIFDKYLLDRKATPANVTSIKVVKAVKPVKSDRPNVFQRFMRLLIGTPGQPTDDHEEEPQQKTA